MTKLNKFEILKKFSSEAYRKDDLSFQVGDKVKVTILIKEEKGSRTQLFEGFVMAIKHGTGINGRFTVRRVDKDGIAVEKIFPVHSEFIEKVEVVKSHKVRRSKLGYTRGFAGKLKLKELKGKATGKRVAFVSKKETAQEAEVAPVVLEQVVEQAPEKVSE